MPDGFGDRVKCYLLGARTERAIGETWDQMNAVLSTFTSPAEISRFTGEPLGESRVTEVSELRDHGRGLSTVASDSKVCADGLSGRLDGLMSLGEDISRLADSPTETDVRHLRARLLSASMATENR